MIIYRQEIDALFDFYEEAHLSEKEIFLRSIELAKKHNLDRDYLFDLNDVVMDRGYCFQFDVPSLNREAFDNKKYCQISANATKSKEKTFSLVKYLTKVNDHRLVLASLHTLKTKFLIELGLLSNKNEYINSNNELNLRNLLYKSFDENGEAKEILIEFLSSVGVEYSTLEYMRFKLDLEYLLWTIEREDPNYGYQKVNTLKVAFNIAPKEFFIRGEKNYYNPKFAKVRLDYLTLVDKKAIQSVINYWGEDGNNLDGTGYLVLYKALCLQVKDK